MNQVAESLDIGEHQVVIAGGRQVFIEQTGVLDAQLHFGRIDGGQVEGEDLAFHVDRHGLIVTQ